MKQVKFTRPGGQTMDRQEDGSVWVSMGGGYSCVGYIKNGYCTVYPPTGAQYKGYVSVFEGLLLNPKKLGIKELRVIVQRVVDSDRGPVHKIKYYYLPRERFKEVIRKGQRVFEHSSSWHVWIRNKDLGIKSDNGGTE
jgi:hypothetical protein